jgi:hypothetical protein
MLQQIDAEFWLMHWYGMFKRHTASYWQRWPVVARPLEVTVLQHRVAATLNPTR